MSVILDAAPKFAFLALPPPPKKNRAPAPVLLPSSPRPRSRSIAAWAESVHPGSPGLLTPAPVTPIYNRPSPRSSTFRRPSFSARSRRQSISSTRSRIPSASFLNLLDTPTTNSHPLSSPFTTDGKDQKLDLMAFGYTSVFAINFPSTTPATPEMYKPKPPSPSPALPAVPATKTSRGMFKRIQAIAMRGKSSPSKKPKAQAKHGKARPSPVVTNYVAVSSKKRAMYAMSPSDADYAVEKKKRCKYAAALPPTVMQEAQLRQVMEGGSLEYNIKMIMEEKAKREGATKVQVVEGAKVVEGVDDVWRDGEGGLWWDQEEEWEFAHLLGGKVPISARATMEEWISFGDKENDKENDNESLLSSRRSSRDSDLHESYAIKVDDSMDDLRVISHARSLSTSASPNFPQKAPILMAIPSRPSRMAKHLRQPEFLLDGFPSLTSPYPASPRSTKFLAGGGSGGVVRRERCRSLVRQKRAAPPPPLELVPPSPHHKLAIDHEGEEEGKREFLANSFEPAYTVNSSVSTSGTKGGLLSVPAAPGMKKKGSLISLSSLFKKGEKK